MPGHRAADPGDPEFPYVGKYVNTLSLRQVRTMDCGSRTLPEFPGQRAVPGAPMATLREVFELVNRYRARGVKLNVETKVEAGAPHEIAPREQFVQVTLREIRRAGMLRQVTIQSDPLKAVTSFGADAFSPVHGFPQNGKVTDPGYVPYVTKDMVGQAHALGLKVIPWTVDDEPTLRTAARTPRAPAAAFMEFARTHPLSQVRFNNATFKPCVTKEGLGELCEPR